MNFCADVEAIFDMVLADFDRSFVLQETPNPKRDILGHQIREFVVNAKATLDGPVEMEFARQRRIQPGRSG